MYMAEQENRANAAMGFPWPLKAIARFQLVKYQIPLEKKAGKPTEPDYLGKAGMFPKVRTRQSQPS